MTRLDNLQEFIMSTSKGLAKEPEENDYTGLVNVMALIIAVRDRQAETDVMFEPLKQTIDMLKTCGVDMSEKVYNQLEVTIITRTLFDTETKKRTMLHNYMIYLWCFDQSCLGKVYCFKNNSCCWYDSNDQSLWGKLFIHVFTSH